MFEDQVRSIFPFVNKLAITFVIAGGVGLFIMLGLLRTVLNLSIKWTFFIAYFLLFAVSFAAPGSFIGIAFDSGGATTGPMTVPFIMALGLGVSSVRNDNDNSFGLTGICSVGPVMAVLIYSIVLKLAVCFLQIRYLSLPKTVQQRIVFLRLSLMFYGSHWYLLLRFLLCLLFFRFFS